MPVDQQGHWFPPSTIDPTDLRTPHSPGYTYRDPIPQPTTRTPGELLIEQYGDRSATTEWADVRDLEGVLRKQRQTQWHHRDVLPIGSAGLIGEWPRPEGNQSVPVLASPSSTNQEDVVKFVNQDGTLGISVKDILAGNWRCLQGANDIVLQKLRGMDVPFAIQWQGYEKQQSTIHTRLEKGGPLTRLNLAIQITMAYAAFFGKVEDNYMLPQKVGFYNIALHQGKNAREDSLGVQFTQLRLLRFYEATDGHFVAQVTIA